MASLFALEDEKWSQGKYILGLDEAGYGCLAGSMFISGVIFERGFDPPQSMRGINDSKKMTEYGRNSLEEEILSHAKHAFTVQVTVDQINSGNPYWLRFSVAKDWIQKNQLNLPKDTVVVYDGDRSIDGIGFESESLVKGDSKSFSIAAASILSKVAKDREMRVLHLKHPEYNWASNKGYGTPDHLSVIRGIGITEQHRIKYCSKYIDGVK